MTPLERSFCWHLRRDIFIRANGDVSFCKQDIKKERVLGNMETSSLSKIWLQQKENWLDNFYKKYPQNPNCKVCDEYFTFNL